MTRAAEPMKPSSSVVRRRVVISGRVQGVGYRAWLRRKARAAGLVGEVRNRDDGSVEAILQGPLERVDQVIRQCRSGPLLARVVDSRKYRRVSTALLGLHGDRVIPMSGSMPSTVTESQREPAGQSFGAYTPIPRSLRLRHRHPVVLDTWPPSTSGMRATATPSTPRFKLHLQFRDALNCSNRHPTFCGTSIGNLRMDRR